jgi:hypothetical protein
MTLPSALFFLTGRQLHDLGCSIFGLCRTLSTATATTMEDGVAPSAPLRAARRRASWHHGTRRCALRPSFDSPRCVAAQPRFTRRSPDRPSLGRAHRPGTDCRGCPGRVGRPDSRVRI